MEPETKAELSRAGARVVATSGAPSRELYERQVHGNGKPQAVVGERPQPLPTIIETISSNTADDRDDDAQMIAALRAWIERKRRKLDGLERWAGTK